MSIEAHDAEIGVVIPTRARRDLLQRALASVAAQTLRPRKVVVVLDGADTDVERELRERDDLEIDVVVVDPPRGPSHARNVGADALETSLVAFLDDDDEWLPDKLERQVPLLDDADVSYTRVLAKRAGDAILWPRHLPSDEATSEYLFDRRRPWSGAGLLLTSTIVARAELLTTVRFDESLRQHEDWDWALRAIAAGRLAFCGDALTVWHLDVNRRRLTDEGEWHDSLAWAQSRRHLFTRRAYAGFVLVNVYTVARRSRDRKAALTLAREALRNGAPTASQWLIFAGLTVLRPDRLERLRFVLNRSRPTSDPRVGHPPS